MNRIFVDLYRRDTSAPLAGFTCHFFDLRSRGLSDDVRDEQRWNEAHRSGWPDMRYRRIGSAPTGLAGRAEFEYEGTGRGSDSDNANLWLVVTSCEATSNGSSQVAYAAPDVRVAAGASEHFCVHVAPERLSSPSARPAVARTLSGSIRDLLSRHATSPRADGSLALLPAAAAAQIDRIESARRDAVRSGAWSRPQAFPMQVRWVSAMGSNEGDQLGFDASTGLTHTPRGGSPVALRLRRVAREVDHERPGVSLRVGERGEFDILLPSLPDNLRIDEPAESALYKAFAAPRNSKEGGR